MRLMSNSLNTCRSCGHADLQPVLSLGQTPLANALLTAEQLSKPEPLYPLELVFCGACTLVQINHSIAPESLFREYLYFSSFSDALLRHSERHALEVIQGRRLTGDSLVVEVASNDGYLLQYYKRAGVPVLGIEPAINIAEVARAERDIPTVCEFFGESFAARLREEGYRADIIHANNVLAHVPHLNDFVRGLRLLLKEDGVCIIEVPYVKDLIDRCEFDTIYHEHLSYFSLTALKHLFDRHGMVIENVERLPIHGGSLRVTIALEGATEGGNVLELLREEQDWGVGSIDFYLGFSGRVERLKAELRNFISSLKQRNERLAAYGAAAKGCTLLNYFQLGKQSLDFVVDRSTYKQGRYMPGVHLPVSAPARLLDEMPSHVLLLTWNFADEILEQQAEYRARGGHFIIPIPELKVV